MRPPQSILRSFPKSPCQKTSSVIAPQTTTWSTMTSGASCALRIKFSKYPLKKFAKNITSTSFPLKMWFKIISEKVDTRRRLNKSRKRSWTKSWPESSNLTMAWSNPNAVIPWRSSSPPSSTAALRPSRSLTASRKLAESHFFTFQNKTKRRVLFRLMN